MTEARGSVGCQMASLQHALSFPPCAGWLDRSSDPKLLRLCHMMTACVPTSRCVRRCPARVEHIVGSSRHSGANTFTDAEGAVNVLDVRPPPRATRRDYLDHLRDLIASYGWAVQGVSRDGLHPPWAYTVGLTEVGCAELVVTGISVARATGLLNDVASHVLHSGVALIPGEQIPLIGGPTIEIVELSEINGRLVTAVDIYGPDIRALQLVHADDRGHWPWEVGCRGVRGGQPVLGVRTSPPASAA
jgi:hypothetical protein